MWKQIVESNGHTQKQLFLKYCREVVRLQETGILTKEEAARKIVGGFRYKSILEEPKFEDLFDIASDTELSRYSSCTQESDSWDAKTADKIKEREWSHLVKVVKYIEI